MATKKVATRRKARPPAQPVDQGVQFIQMIERAASDPNVDIEKMERLYQMAKDMREEQAVQAYNTGMALVQQEVPGVLKDRENLQTQSTYASLTSIVKAIRPVLTSHGFSASFSEGETNTEGMVRVILAVSHNGGDQRLFHYDSPITVTGIGGKRMMTDTHGKASAVTYAKRYLLDMVFMLQLDEMDDDGNAAGQAQEFPITEHDAAAIRRLLEKAGADEAKILEHYKIDTLEELLASKYIKVVNQLKAKIKLKKEDGNDSAAES